MRANQYIVNIVLVEHVIVIVGVNFDTGVGLGVDVEFYFYMHSLPPLYSEAPVT
jgi:hypothetical protein